MVQVDVFWSYGLGAGFAVAAARQLRVRHELRSSGEASGRLSAAAGEPGAGEGGARELAAALGGGDAGRVEDGWWPDFKALLQNRYMLLNILYVALLFAPSGIYLVWGFPQWETMQAGTRAMPAWLIVSFAITNVTQGVLGFWVTERLIVHGRQYLAFLQAFAGYFGMFFILVNGWDRFGWHRFFSEDRAGFAAWNDHPALHNVWLWLSSDVALTLYGMGLILIPVMAVVMAVSIRGGYRIGGAFAPDRRPRGTVALVAVTALALLSGVPAAIVVHLLIDQLGWVLGAATGGVLVYAVLLRDNTGLLCLAYRQLALEDEAYRKLRGGTRRQPVGSRPQLAHR